MIFFKEIWICFGDLGKIFIKNNSYNDLLGNYVLSMIL